MASERLLKFLGNNRWRNPRTGNFVDHVAAAYAAYAKGGGDLTFLAWHNSKLCPQHGMCSECVR